MTNWLQRLEWLALAVGYGVVVAIISVNTGIGYAQSQEAQRWADLQVSLTAIRQIHVGERIYLASPEAVLNAIRRVEGVPSYGVMTLAAIAGRHQLVSEERGRTAARIIVDRLYAAWKKGGRSDDFFAFMRDRYCGNVEGCQFWLGNLVAVLPDNVLADVARELVMSR